MNARQPSGPAGAGSFAGGSAQSGTEAGQSEGGAAQGAGTDGAPARGAGIEGGQSEGGAAQSGGTEGSSSQRVGLESARAQGGPVDGLSADDLVKAYRGRRVVDHVSFHVRPGEVVGLLGPNGAGKTTSFNMVVGLVRPEAGRVDLGGVDITRQAIHHRARAGLGYLPQETSVFRRLSVRDNLLAVLELDTRSTKRDRSDRARALIDEFELGHVASSYGDQLSGGERRRLEIARCLASQPKIVLLDEPFAGIDPLAVSELQELIRRLVSRRIGVLITDHNVRETLGICSRAYILVAGKVVEQGTSREIAESDRARALYLGHQFRL